MMNKIQKNIIVNVYKCDCNLNKKLNK